MNYKTRNSMQLLDSHLATGTEASYIYTPPAALKATDYSSLKIIISGQATAALALQLIVNSDETSKYYLDGADYNVGTEVLIDVNTAANWEIIPASLITGAFVFSSEITLFLPNSALAAENIQMNSTSRAASLGGNQLTGALDVVYSTITEIEIQTSTSTWKAGTKIDIYGIRNQ